MFSKPCLLAVIAMHSATGLANGAPYADKVEPSQGVTRNAAKTVIPNDCGLYAAQSMLQFLGVSSRINDLRDAIAYRYPVTGVPEGEGYSLADLRRLMGSFGVSVQGFRLEPAGLSQIPLPAILRLRGLGGGHFVTLHHVDSGGVAQFYDPLLGKVGLPLSILVERWVNPENQGVALLIDTKGQAVGQ